MVSRLRLLGRVMVLAGALIGAVLGYFGGAYLGCGLWPSSNLCGLPGVIPGLPLGALLGTMLARRIAQAVVV